MNGTELTIFIVIGALVTGLGVVAARWRRAPLDHLDEWGLAGRQFGSVVTWFLLGGDLYTAYTFVAVPGLVFAKGALGLFAIPYTIIVYPIVYVTMPKLWQVARNKGYVTGSDYVKDRFDSRFLALLIAITGIVATMPYIALQIYGIKVVLAAMGVSPEIALIVAFLALALFTYVSGLRAPALIAMVKDSLIWLVVIVAVIYIPIKLGGYGAIFHAVEAHNASVGAKKASPDVLSPALGNAYATLALGSAFALFLYPHALTGVFSAKSQKAVKRNAAFLPAYSFMLGLIGLFGFMAIAAPAAAHPTTAEGGANGAIASLFQWAFPSWFTGIAFGAIAIGAIVPASVMSIAAANLFSRNIWREFIQPAMSTRGEANLSKVVSLIVKLGALFFVLFVPTQNILYYQTAGGVWMINALPAIMLALFIRRLNTWAVILGWAAGQALGTFSLFQVGFVTSFDKFLGGFGGTIYIGIAALALNLIVVFLGTLVAESLGSHTRARISDEDYQQPVSLGGAPARVATPLAGATG
jgi:SSS family solute:Na+ symporter